jgi:hypothetical protein
MKSNIWISLTLVCLTFLSVSCSLGSEDSSISGERITTRQPERLPITSASQSLNLKYGELFNVVLAVLRNRKIPIAVVDSSNGMIVTRGFDLKERLCGSAGADRVPLQCNLTYTVKVKTVNQVASKFVISYQENCSNYALGSLRCPGSRAERLMLNIVEDIKRSAGVVDEQEE